MKAFRIVRVVIIVALAIFFVLGLNWRAGLTDSGLAAHQPGFKKADVSVSIANEGHVIRVESIQPPGKPGKPCAATLIFEASPTQ